MPLPPAVEFLSAQTRDDGSPLCHFGTMQMIMVVPPGRTVTFRVTPLRGTYAHYGFRVLLDASMVPGAFRVSVFHYGIRPLYTVIYPSILGLHTDYFLRVTHVHPVITFVTNLTALNQQFVSYGQILVVSTEDDLKELERRLRTYFGQVPVGAE